MVGRLLGRGTFTMSITGCFPRTGRQVLASACRSGSLHSIPRWCRCRTETLLSLGLPRYAVTRSQAASDMSPGSMSRSTEAQSGHLQSSSTTSDRRGLAAVAARRRPRSGRPRDRRSRLGLLGSDPAGERGGAVEPQGLRQRRPAAHPHPRRSRSSTPDDVSRCEVSYPSSTARVRSRCLHPGQQQGRHWPCSNSSCVRRNAALPDR